MCRLINGSSLLGLLLLSASAAVMAQQEITSSDTILAKLQPVAVEQRVAGILHSVDIQIAFAINSASLSPNAQQQLQALAAALASPALNGCQFYLIGHTDSSGQADFNQQLSARRAEAVKTWLLAQPALANLTLSSLGLGSQQLLPAMAPEDPRHRRVEVKLSDAEQCLVQQGVTKEADGELKVRW